MLFRLSHSIQSGLYKDITYPLSSVNVCFYLLADLDSLKNESLKKSKKFKKKTKRKQTPIKKFEGKLKDIEIPTSKTFIKEEPSVGCHVCKEKILLKNFSEHCKEIHGITCVIKKVKKDQDEKKIRGVKRRLEKIDQGWKDDSALKIKKIKIGKYP